MALELLRTAKQHGIGSLVFYARAGYYTLPAGIDDDYTTLEGLAASYDADPQQATADSAAALTATLRLDTVQDRGVADGIITTHIQPALDTYLTDFQANSSIGRGRWDAIRTAWRILRGPTEDPEGLDSIHAEVGNVLALGPEWQPNHSQARYATPWQTSTFEARLLWLLDHNADVWAPTGNEQTTAWINNRNVDESVPAWAR